MFDGVGGWNAVDWVDWHTVTLNAIGLLVPLIAGATILVLLIRRNH